MSRYKSAYWGQSTCQWSMKSWTVVIWLVIYWLVFQAQNCVKLLYWTLKRLCQTVPFGTSLNCIVLLTLPVYWQTLFVKLMHSKGLLLTWGVLPCHKPEVVRVAIIHCSKYIHTQTAQISLRLFIFFPHHLCQWSPKWCSKHSSLMLFSECCRIDHLKKILIIKRSH